MEDLISIESDRWILFHRQFEFIYFSIRVARLLPNHTVFVDMASSSREKKTYARTVQSNNSPLHNTWWRHLQEEDEDETISIAMKRSMEDQKVIC